MRRLSPRRGLFVAVACLLASACMTVGHEFPLEPIGTLRPGAQDRDDVQRMFGTPWRTGLENGLSTWTYGHYRHSLFGETRARDLVIRFDPEGKVQSYTFSSTYPEDAKLRVLPPPL